MLERYATDNFIHLIEIMLKVVIIVLCNYSIHENSNPPTFDGATLKHWLYYSLDCQLKTSSRAITIVNCDSFCEKETNFRFV